MASLTHAKDNIPAEAHATEAHHRHTVHDGDVPDEEDQLTLIDSYQQSPKLKGHVVRHMSMDDDFYQSLRGSALAALRGKPAKNTYIWSLIVVLLLVSLVVYHHLYSRQLIIPMEKADEHLLDIGDGLHIWFRTWGNPAGIPILFVHGGPGNNIAAYYLNGNPGNKRFFDVDTFWVVEIDQRGTGKSQPSVADDWHNMEHYAEISIDKMAADFEKVREYLGIDQWLVWGGSFGSTLSINYGERYPEACLALILRGIYLDTAEEVSMVYSRNTYIKNQKRLREFDILFDYANNYVERQHNAEPLDPNDAERIMRVYAEMITSGDKYATWHWFVFENNLMEIDPRNILDPTDIASGPEYFPMALTVSFFETRLWLHGSYDEPASNLLHPEKIDRLTMPIWICQGQLDEVCPPKSARVFADSLEERALTPYVVTRFLNATHEDTDPTIEQCLKRSLREFVEVQRNEIL